MSITKNIPQITEKDTKAAIIEKFEQVVKILKAKEAAKLDPAKEVAQKAAVSTLEKAQTIVKSDIGAQINEMTNVVTKALSDALAEVNTRVANYKDLDEAIALKQAEIQELFKIETNAYALVALINMQEEQKLAFDAEMAAKKEKAQSELQAIIDETTERRQSFQTEMTQMRKELEANRKREEEEYKYNRDRSRKLDNDKWDDEKNDRSKTFHESLTTQQKQMDELKAQLDKRVEELNAKETAVKELEDKVASIPAQIEAAVAKAVKDAETSASRSFQFQKQLLEKEHQGTVSLLNAKVETLTTALTDEKARSLELAAKLDEAYAKIENISGKAVEAASGAKYIDRLESMTKEQTKQSTVK